MNKPIIQNWVRVVLAFCGIALFVVLFVPMWRIDLDAPQYPEGLYMLIYPDKVGGDVDIINGLNHYIGMKTIHTEDFKEFAVLPWVIGGFGFAFLLTALARRRWLLYLVTGLFVAFGIVAMIDFWKWEYDYGHNLDPNAAIIVPGMAYQPPLIGFKQLLNFGAYSMPDVGGWIFVSVGVALIFIIFMDWKWKKKWQNTANLVVPFALWVSLMSCTNEPSPIRIGKDQCDQCKMTLSNPRFGAELVTNKGKIFKFDDTRCLKSFLEKEKMDSSSISGIYLSDFCGDHGLNPGKLCLLLESAELHSPMGGNVAAFSNSDSANVHAKRTKGRLISWKELLAQ